MSESAGLWRRFGASVLMFTAWAGFLLVFLSVPYWASNWNIWGHVWNSLEVDPPAATSFLILVRSKYLPLVIIASILASLASIWGLWMTRDMRSKLLKSFLFAALTALPMVGVWLIFEAGVFIPQRQLAHNLDLDQLPSYSKFPEYIATARRQSEDIDRRRNALYSMQVMCALEKLSISPPAEIGRDSSPIVIDEYVRLCRSEAEPIRLQFFAASMLLHKYLRGKLWDYPPNSKADREQAEKLVVEVFLQTVLAGGPKELGLSEYEANRPGDWALSEFQYVNAGPSILQRLLTATKDNEAPVRAQAVGALGAIHAGQTEPEVLNAMERLKSDEDEAVRQAAARAQQNIKRHKQTSDRQ